MIRRLALNTSTNFALEVLTAGLRMAIIPVIVSETSSEAYGIIVLASTIMGYFGIMKSGVPTGTVKYVAEYEEEGGGRAVSKVVNTSLAFHLVVGMIMAIAVVAFTEAGGLGLFQISSANRPRAANVLYIAAGIAVVKWPALTFGQALDGLQRYAENNLCKGVGRVSALGGAIGVALFGAPIELIFLVQNSDFLLNTPLQYQWLRRLKPDVRFMPSDATWDTLWTIGGYSVWMVLSKVARLLLYQTDRIIIGVFLPVSYLTVYKVVTIPFNYIKKICGLFNSAVLPVVSSVEASSGKEELGRFIYLLGRYANALAAALSVLGVFFSAPFIRLWMGPEYVEYAWIAQIACGFQMVWQSNAALVKVFFGSGLVRTLNLIAFVAALVNVPLGIWWVQEIGVAGVVFSTVAASVLSIPLQYVFAFPELNVDRPSYVRALARGQWGSWAVGLALIPLWKPIQAIDGWIELLASGSLVSMTLFGVVAFAAVEGRHRIGAWNFVRSSVVQPFL